MKTSTTRMVSFWILVLIVITGCVSTTGAYNYVMTHSQVTYIPDEYYYYSSTQWEEEYATASASSGGASCTAETFAQGNSGGDASASTTTLAQTAKEWEWDGPAGTAPGGSLFWYYAGDGYSQVSGINTTVEGVPSSGNISSDAIGAGALAYGDTTYDGSGTASGTVEDTDTGTGTVYYQGTASYYDQYGNPVYDTDIDETYGSGTFDGSIVWNSYGEDTSVIPAGTGSFEIIGQVGCSCSSTANNTTGTSESESSAHTTLVMYTDFTSN